MKTIKKFIANLRRKLFTDRTEREIYHKIFPHLNQRADHGYPFSDQNGLFKASLDGSIGLRRMRLEFDQATRKMPEAEALALSYIAHRDLNERLAMYLKFAQEREYNPECEPHLMATAA